MSENQDLPDTPFKIERLMRQAKRSFTGESYDFEAEFREAMPQLIERGLLVKREATLAEDTLEMAQELAYQAYESGKSELAAELAAKSLDLNPKCVDALAVKAFVDTESDGELIPALEYALACAEESLGEEYFENLDNGFWNLLEMRPYLRTMKQLSRVLWATGRRFDTIDLYEDIREFDPDDHIGVSSLLLTSYLSMGEVQRSWNLLEEISGEYDLVHLWAWVLIYLMANSLALISHR